MKPYFTITATKPQNKKQQANTTKVFANPHKNKQHPTTTSNNNNNNNNKPWEELS